jgi:photosystem II stability/assembly factor-like uncharacterized protein
MADKWVLLIPGACNALAIDPQTPATMYVSTSPGAMKSIDGGSSWRMVNFGQFSPQVSQLLIDPKSPQTIHASTSAGLLKTTDGGESWEAVTTTGLSGPFYLVIDPLTPTIMYAATNTTVFKSTDGASTWSAIRTLNDAVGGNGGWINSSVALMIDPVTPSNLYASFAAQQPPGYFDLPVYGLSHSPDGGASWKNITPDALLLAGQGTMGIDPQTPAKFYLISGNNVYSTTDSGANWGTPTPISGNISVLIIDSRLSPSIMYAGSNGSGVSRSADGGVSWTAFNDGLFNLNVPILALDPVNTSVLYAATSSGVFKWSPDPA